MKDKIHSEYIGVTWDKVQLKWRARITFKKRLYHLGLFDSEEKAAIAYNKKLKELKDYEDSINVESLDRMKEIQIDLDRQTPEKKLLKRKYGVIFAALIKLEIGQSFYVKFIELEMNRGQGTSCIRQCIQQFKNESSDKSLDFITRSSKEGIRVWRV